MPYVKLILFSYVVQGSHCLLGALHAWLFMQGSMLFFNAVMVAVNALSFINAANWRASLRAYIKRRQRLYDFFRR